jgi:ABC-2 type transport system ATP-binding protein
MINSTSNILEVGNLCKRYPAFSLKDISFAVPGGYICGFIGPNGSGKTTTIKSILGIVHPDFANIKLFGTSSPPQADDLGVVMDMPFFVDLWTVDGVEKAIAPFYTRWDSKTFAACLSRFGIHREKKVSDLSRGMKVKIQLAVALSHGAKLLILDEPTSGLDPVARNEVCDILREFVADENHSVLFSTHITSDLDRTADYILFILGGRLVFSGAKDELTDKYLRVAGGLQDIDSRQKQRIIGYREHATGFEGMIDSKSIREFNKNNIIIEPVSLDEIIIFMNQGVKTHE